MFTHKEFSGVLNFEGYLEYGEVKYKVIASKTPTSNWTIKDKVASV